MNAFMWAVAEYLCLLAIIVSIGLLLVLIGAETWQRRDKLFRLWQRKFSR